MNGRTNLAAIGLAAALLFGGVACSSSDAAEKLAEKAIEDAGNGDVDIDSEDGTVKYTDKDGNETEMNIDGSGASLPKDWPSDLAPPDSVKIVTSNTSTVDGETTMTVLGEAEGTIEDFLPAIKSQLEGAGYEITQDSSSTVGTGSYAGLTAEKGDQEVTVTIAGDPTSESKVTIAMNISGKA